jgi:hypothetical protein
MGMACAPNWARNRSFRSCQSAAIGHEVVPYRLERFHDDLCTYASATGKEVPSNVSRNRMAIRRESRIDMVKKLHHYHVTADRAAADVVRAAISTLFARCTKRIG